MSLQADPVQSEARGGGYICLSVLFTGAQVMLMKAEDGPMRYGVPRVGLGFLVLHFAVGCDPGKSPVTSDDDIWVCLPRASFLCLSCSCLAAHGKARECPPAVAHLTERV